MKPFYQILISIGVIMATTVTAGLVFHYNTSKTANAILFILVNIVFLGATIWIVVNAIRMVKQGGGV